MSGKDEDSGGPNVRIGYDMGRAFLPYISVPSLFLCHYH